MIALALLLGIGPALPSVDVLDDYPSILPCQSPLAEPLPFDLDWEPLSQPDWGLIDLDTTLDLDCSCDPYV
ncbi:MAG: hypothetical protein GY953_14315 [bacterium]|nr:hypothetical protein [bacterium]